MSETLIYRFFNFADIEDTFITGVSIIVTQNTDSGLATSVTVSDLDRIDDK